MSRASTRSTPVERGGRAGLATRGRFERHADHRRQQARMLGERRCRMGRRRRRAAREQRSARGQRGRDRAGGQAHDKAGVAVRRQHEARGRRAAVDPERGGAVACDDQRDRRARAQRGQHGLAGRLGGGHQHGGGLRRGGHADDAAAPQLADGTVDREDGRIAVQAICRGGQGHGRQGWWQGRIG
jgi:hypothetical protein